jgi:two-component system, response regulator
MTGVNMNTARGCDGMEKVILLVEDNPDDVLLTKLAFGNNKILNRMVVATDGEEALDWLFCKGKFSDRDPNEKPLVVLMDLKLPKISGLEVLKQIRENESTKLLPVVILTTSREDCDRVNGYNLGCNSYIRKPVDFNKFSEAVSKLGFYWLVLNEPPY